MKKIITVLDSGHPSNGAIDLGCYLASLSHASLTGIFPGYPIDTHAPFERFVNDTAPSVVLGRHKAEMVETAITHFRDACQKHGIVSNVRRDIEEPGTEVATEMLFADVLIVDEAVSFTDDDTDIPSDFITSLLSRANCPVIVASPTFSPIEQIVFAYDGAASSIFALKQFTYLFPEFRNTRLLVVEITDHSTVDQSDRLNEWLSNNYSEIVFEVLTGDAHDRLLEIAMLRQKALLIMGAFGRSRFSSFFKSSAAGVVVKYSISPTFIAHR